MTVPQAGVPEVGAQVWIDRSMTPEQVDHWMKLLAENAMPVARIFVWADQVEPRPGQREFGIYDAAFDSAQRWGVRIIATLGPRVFPPRSAQEAQEALEYIRRVVRHYRDHPALDTWILWNEPSFFPSDAPFVTAQFHLWLREKYPSLPALNETWHSNYETFEEIPGAGRTGPGTWDRYAGSADWHAFGRDYQTSQVQFLADAVRAHDTGHDLHINPHGLIGNLAGSNYNLPAWRPALTSLGVSCHPAWHFELLQRRDRYALGVSYMCDLVRGASEPLPFWVTELQGGNNIYSGTKPLCPDARDIAQWLWTALVCGAERVIFWQLNIRVHGTEGGEWALLNFQNQPTERMMTAGRAARTLQRHAAFFAGARPQETAITLILSLETMTLQLKYGDVSEHVQEVLGFYEALQELGIPVHVKHFDDFKWSETGAAPQFVLLPHVSAISEEQAARIAAFVRNGGTVLATGLTGFFDPHCHVRAGQASPLDSVFGGRFQEVRRQSGDASLTLQSPPLTLPSHIHQVDIDNLTGDILGATEGRVAALRQDYGAGEVYWLPGLIGTGSWLADREPLSQLLQTLAAPWIDAVPFKFAARQPHLLLRVLRNGEQYLTSVTNGSTDALDFEMVVPDGFHPAVLWPSSSAAPAAACGTLAGRETLVTLWTKDNL